MAGSKLEEVLAAIAALEREGDRLLIELAEGEPLAIAVADLLYATSEKKGIRLVMTDERELVTRPSENLQGLAERLAQHPNIVRCHNSRLVNLEHVRKVSRMRKGLYQLTFYDGRHVTLTINQDQVMRYFGIESLDHVVPWNEHQAALIQEHLRRYEKDIRFMSDEEIRANFSYASGRLVTRWIIGNLIWQVYNWIQEGRIDKLDGNIRSFWYSHVKPVLARFYPVSDKQYDAVTSVIAHYVGDRHFFRYADIGFVDDSGSNWVIGERLPHVILAAEKLGHWRALQQVAKSQGVTITALGGSSSLLTTENLVDEFVAKGVELKQRFYLLTDVDYDPAGNIIANAFARQLMQMGASSVLRFDLIQPENFLPEEIKYFKFPVPQDSDSDIKKTRDWMDRRKSPFGGGLPGEDGKPTPYGLESDAMERRRFLRFAGAAIDELAKATPDETWEAILERIRKSRPPIETFLAPLEILR